MADRRTNLFILVISPITAFIFMKDHAAVNASSLRSTRKTHLHKRRSIIIKFYNPAVTFDLKRDRSALLFLTCKAVIVIHMSRACADPRL
jgi:hypothetical protein